MPWFAWSSGRINSGAAVSGAGCEGGGWLDDPCAHAPGEAGLREDGPRRSSSWDYGTFGSVRPGPGRPLPSGLLTSLHRVHRELVQYSHSRPHSSHHARPTALILPRSYLRRALIPPRSSHDAPATTPETPVRMVYGDRRCTSSVMLCVRTCLAPTILSSFLNSNCPVLVLRPPDLERGGLRSPIGHVVIRLVPF